jgi:hypothetical protein
MRSGVGKPAVKPQRQPVTMKLTHYPGGAFLELTAAAGALVCRNGHNFDLAREGYVNLLRGGRRRPAARWRHPRHNCATARNSSLRRMMSNERSPRRFISHPKLTRSAVASSSRAPNTRDIGMRSAISGEHTCHRCSQGSKYPMRPPSGIGIRFLA